VGQLELIGLCSDRFNQIDIAKRTCENRNRLQRRFEIKAVRTYSIVPIYPWVATRTCDCGDAIIGPFASISYSMASTSPGLKP
jgi:hypothetical protein